MVPSVLLASLTLLALDAPQPGDPMVVSVGNDVGWQVVSPEEGRKAFLERGELRCGPEAMRAHWEALGDTYAANAVTAFEPYVKWMLLEPSEGVWDPTFYDAELAEFRRHGLQWVPFLIAGPAYATPPWFKDSPESVFASDLASGEVSRDQSIWNPHLRPRVRAWLARFFAHYAHEEMQSVLLGISGDFGESIYTAGGNAWTDIWDGAYPQHFGWWCGDVYAADDFRQAMERRYGTVARISEAWGEPVTSWEEVRPFVPDAGHHERARLDMIRWYMGAMTDWSEWWVATVRELAPEVRILLCTGGSAAPELGADMSAQTKMVARYGAGMRITNEASDYASNFHLTRHISSASRLYGTYFGYEPAGGVDDAGTVGRVFNAVGAGAWELFHYDNPPSPTRYAPYRELLRIREPLVEAAMLWPRTSVDLGVAPALGQLGGLLRDAIDVDYVDERMIADGALEPLRLLVWGSGRVLEAEDAERLGAAVEAGLVLLVPDGWRPRSPEGPEVFPSDLALAPGEARAVGSGAVIAAAGPEPARVAEALCAISETLAGLALPALSPDASADLRLDGVFVTVTSQDVLLYNRNGEARSVTLPSGGVEVPAHGIVSVPR